MIKRAPSYRVLREPALDLARSDWPVQVFERDRYWLRSCARENSMRRSPPIARHGSEQPRVARRLRSVALGGGRHRIRRGRAIVVGGGPGRGCCFRCGSPDAAEAAGPAGSAAIAASAGVVRWSVTAVTAWLPAMALVEPLHGLTFALLHLACMQILSAVVPPALAAPAQSLATNQTPWRRQTISPFQ